MDRAPAPEGLRAHFGENIIALHTPDQHDIVRWTAGYSPNLRDDFVVSDNMCSPALPSQQFQRHAVAVFFHLRIIPYVRNVADMHDEVVGDFLERLAAPRPSPGYRSSLPA